MHHMQPSNIGRDPGGQKTSGCEYVSLEYQFLTGVKLLRKMLSIVK